jgi:hypothetical protein
MISNRIVVNNKLVEHRTRQALSFGYKAYLHLISHEKALNYFEI